MMPAVAADVAVAARTPLCFDFGHRTQRRDDVVVPFFFKPVHGAHLSLSNSFTCSAAGSTGGFDIDTCHSERFINAF